MTRKTDYALVALATLAREHEGEGRPLSARQLAEQHDLPLPLLMNALKELHRAQIIESRRGAGGGYYLLRGPEAITIREVIEAMEGPVSVTLCSDEEHETGCNTCQIVVNCPISDPMQKFNIMLNTFLSRITLKSLITSEPIFAMPLSGVQV